MVADCHIFLKKTVLCGGYMRLQERFQIAIRFTGFSLSIERAYWGWIKCFVRFQKISRRDLLTSDNVRDFHSHLVMKKHVVIRTQQQASSCSL
ncbi:phage integrase N-terminal SAM-like domain-containing protein [Endozoicomonas sp. 8E]|uniref:phage integrase N-terminal SAM-like domain-containing protein n=1 Tax=Endozoicomonas sp. 8E TaxID=3035692 RepID=UPI0039776EDD